MLTIMPGDFLRHVSLTSCPAGRIRYGNEPDLNLTMTGSKRIFVHNEFNYEKDVFIHSRNTPFGVGGFLWQYFYPRKGFCALLMPTAEKTARRRSC